MTRSLAEIDPQTLYGTAEAAQYLRRTRRTIYRMIDGCSLVRRKIGGRLGILGADILALVGHRPTLAARPETMAARMERGRRALASIQEIA